MVRRIGLQQAKQGGDDVPPLQGHPGLSDASEGTGVPESRGEVGVQDPEHHDGARDTRWRDDRMTGRRSHGRLSALNGVVHQGSVAAGVCKEREDPWNSSYDPDDPKHDPNDEAYSPNYDDGNGNVYQWVNVYPINP